MKLVPGKLYRPLAGFHYNRSIKTLSEKGIYMFVEEKSTDVHFFLCFLDKDGLICEVNFGPKSSEEKRQLYIYFKEVTS